MPVPYTPDTPRPANLTVEVSGTGALSAITGRGFLNSITVKTCSYGANAPTIWVFDNSTSATGKVIASNSADHNLAPGTV